MASLGRFEFTLAFTNQRAIEALASACQQVEEASEDMPWNPELKKAVKALRYAAKHIAIVDPKKAGV